MLERSLILNSMCSPLNKHMLTFTFFLFDLNLSTLPTHKKKSHLFLFAGGLGPHHVDVRLGKLFVEELGVLHELRKHRVGQGGLQRSKQVA